LSWDNIQHLFQPAMTIALLAAIESLLCAVVADGMIDDRHDANQELIAQGLANIVSPLFGGIAATGAIARTATNVKSGARTPIAGNRPRPHFAAHPAGCGALLRGLFRWPR
jgi:SulP family sulfate permease